jgi:LPS sulfotransferase NodH
LASTSVAGNPREWLNIQEEQQHRAEWRMDHASDLSLMAYLGIARERSTGPNGISGIKLHYYQFANLPKKMEVVEGFHGLTAPQIMSRLFPNAKYLWLKRRDKARQAISLRLASRSGEWWAIDGVAGDGAPRNTAAPEFDPDVIARIEQTLIGNDGKWQAYFDENGITPLVVHYEDLAADYAGTIAKILKWLGVPNADAIDIPPSRLKRQSDARNEEWLARYTAGKKDRRSRRTPPGHANEADPFARAQKPLDWLPNAWQQWIGHSKLLKTSDEQIAEVLTGNGYCRAAVLAEVQKAALDPYLRGGMRTAQRMNKAASFLNIQGQLARLDSQSTRIERRKNLSRDEFRDRYYAANRPVIIQDLMTGWKAVTAWTPPYLKRIAGDSIVEVMTGRDANPDHERNGGKHRTEIRFADYIDMVHSGRVTNDYCMVANNRFFQRPEAQPFFQDLTAFAEYLNPAATRRHCFLWFGPAGTATPLHHEVSNILLAQVVGRRRYRLVPPAQWQYVYNNCGVFSDVDCERPDFGRHPKFRHATVVDVVVQPGEVLFMPVGWWHHVRALDVSMTVAFTNFAFPNHFAWE